MKGTIFERLERWVLDDPARAAFRYREGGEWRDVTWGEYGERVRAVAGSLLAMGIAEGDQVAILSNNRPEWHMADLGSMAVGARSVPLYLTSAAEQIAYVLGHSEARVIFVSRQAELEKVASVWGRLPRLEKAVLFEGASSDPRVLPWKDFLEMGRAYLARHEGAYEAALGRRSPEEVASIVYTSGTTGEPKGVMLTHRNFLFTCWSLNERMPSDRDGRALSYLPLSHIAERMVSHILHVYHGSTTWFAESLETLARDLRDARPTTFFAVPRVWEKFHAGIQGLMAGLPEEQRIRAQEAVSLGLKLVDLRQEGAEVPEEMERAWREADASLFALARAALGLDQAKYLVSGAAPINPEVIRFFHAIGLPIAEVYGQTEDTGPTTLNPVQRIKIGTVGPAIAGVEVRIAEDGEILVRGENVFKGYFKKPEETAEALEGGWLHSGDIGRLDSDGYLTITDRKKDLIITAGGKNIAPALIESLLKFEPLISQAVVVGDRRPYLVALLALDPEKLKAWAAERGKPQDPEALVRDPEVLASVAESVGRVNSRLSRPEQVKKWAILPAELSVEGGELTPTLKVRRKVVLEKYGDIIESLYAG